MAEIDDATVAARTKEILETDEAIKTQYGDGSLTVRALRKAVAAALNAEESTIKKVVKSTLYAYMDEQRPPEEEDEAVAAEEAPKEEPAPKKKAKGVRRKSRKPTDRLTDKAAFEAKLREDNWQVEERPRSKDGVRRNTGYKLYSIPGETKQYPSLLQVARAHYPEFVTGAATESLTYRYGSEREREAAAPRRKRPRGDSFAEPTRDVLEPKSSAYVPARVKVRWADQSLTRIFDFERVARSELGAQLHPDLGKRMEFLRWQQARVQARLQTISDREQKKAVNCVRVAELKEQLKAMRGDMSKFVE